MQPSELNEMLTALGFESADERSTLEGLLKATPDNLSGPELAEWAAKTEGNIDGALKIDELLAKAESLKAEGNGHFKADELGKATTAYQSAVELLTSADGKMQLQEWWAAHKDTDGAVDAATPLLTSLYTSSAARVEPPTSGVPVPFVRATPNRQSCPCHSARRRQRRRPRRMPQQAGAVGDRCLGSFEGARPRARLGQGTLPTRRRTEQPGQLR